jgi:hypothetical protein
MGHRMRFGIFLAPFHKPGINPTLCFPGGTGCPVSPRVPWPPHATASNRAQRAIGHPAASR